jgi:lipase chaperone LimK
MEYWPGPILPYGVGIREAVASGDLERMQKARDEAEQYLAQAGDLPAALEALKLEIAKLEGGKS